MAAQVQPCITPVGFGRGRRTNNIAVIHTVLSQALVLPLRISQWGPEEDVDEWTRAVLSGIAVAAETAGFNLLWHYWRKHESSEALADALFPARADGAILLCPREEHFPLIDLLSQLEMPCVVAYAHHPSPRVPSVVCDNRGGVAQAVQHLVHLGHRRIGFIAGPSSVLDLEERREGFLDGMAAAGISVDPSLISRTGMTRHAEDVKPLAARMLRSTHRPTALVCATDEIAVGVIQAAWDIGLRTPGDIAVVGFDDAEMATQVSPKLTSVHQPIRQIASRAVYLAACAVVGQEPETASWQIVYPTSLVIRESCGTTPAGSAPADAPRESSFSPDQQMRMRHLEAINDELRELLYIGSHDLRSPLVTIQGFASKLEQKHSAMLDARGKDCLARIRRSATTMSELIEALLGLSRSHNQPLSLQAVAVAEVVESVLRDLEPQIADAKAQVIVSPHLPAVIGDPLCLQQVFMNLLTNALKYTVGQSRPEIRIGYRARGEEHELFVQDNGMGMSPELHDRVFQPFQRGQSPPGTEGAGIGLSIVKAIILRHGGRIWVESQPGEGATFRFTLPRQQLAASPDETQNDGIG